MFYIRFAVIVLSVLSFTACGGGGDDGDKVPPPPAATNPGHNGSTETGGGAPTTDPEAGNNNGSGPTNDDFSLTLRNSYSLAQGASGTLGVTIKREGDPGDIGLSLSGSSRLSRMDAPDKIGWFFKSAGDNANLTLDVGSEVPEGNYELTVTGEANGETRRAPLTLMVAKPVATANLDYGIVYVRVPRSTASLRIRADDVCTACDKHVGEEFGSSFLDTLPEVSHILEGFNAPGQLVWLDEDGNETIIFDCVNGMPAEDVVPPRQNGDDVCLPADPAVSFDGKKVAFAVYHGAYRNERKLGAGYNGEVGKLATPTWAGIYIYYFPTDSLPDGKLTHWTHQDGVWDTAPVWLPDGNMMFTSTRDNVYQRKVKGGPKADYRPVLQLWVANQDGSDPHNVGTQEMQDALHPFVHSSGRVLFSSFQYTFARWWDKRGHGSETDRNLWWLMSVDRRGGNLHAHLRAHYRGVGHLPPNNDDVTITAPHFIGELSNGDICVDVYYRQNNFGGGRILCWPTRGVERSPLGHEGPYPFNMPEGLYVGVPGDSGDSGNPAAHVRDPAGLPHGQLLFAGGIGPSSFCHGGYVAFMPGRTRNGYTCDFGIYRAATMPLDGGPDERDTDAELVVNDPQWHEFMPKPVLSYNAIYGKDKPDQRELPGTGNTSTSIFAAVDAFKGNVRAQGGWQGPGHNFWCHWQGCALQAPAFIQHKDGDDYDTISGIEAIRFWKVVPNKKRKDPDRNPVGSVWGQKLVLLGDVPVQDDGSFKAQLPPNVPFLMAGVDAEGRSIARHQAVMSLRPGEKQVCSGCHLHGPANAGGGEITISAPLEEPKLAPGQKAAPEWKNDIYPMLRKNCGTSCHQGNQPPDFSVGPDALYAELTNNLRPLNAEIKDGMYSAVPWLTKYVNGFFARESLLYWKAAGKRLDGRTDAMRDDDFDFGAEHKSHLDAQQLRLLADWIEAGLYRCQPNNYSCSDSK